MQTFVSAIQFECPSCGEHSQGFVTVPEPDWGAADDLADLESSGQTEAACSECDVSFPAYVQFNHGYCSVTLNDHPSAKIDADEPSYWPPDDADWLNEETPDDPWGIFLEAVEASRATIYAVLGTPGAVNPEQASLLRQMLFSQIIGILEAYLSDTLIRRVLRDDDVLRRLVLEDVELKQARFPLNEILNDGNFVKQTVHAYLQKIVYHNLAKVERVYFAAFQYRIWPSKAVKERLNRSIAVRNDLVHRNGRTIDGGRVVISDVDLDNLIEDCSKLASHVQNEGQEILDF